MDMPGWKINLLTENAVTIMEDKQKELEEIQDEVANSGDSMKDSLINNIAELKDM